ncbi:MAG: hypothetical protein ACJ735_02835 [Actinomycetes bacterium]
MSMSVVPLLGQPAASVRLIDTAVAVPALISHVRPALVLSEADTRHLIAAADEQGVRAGGLFLAGPIGIQLWSAPFDGPDGTPGGSLHLGTVDWSYDTPVKHYATIYRAMVTGPGALAGESTASVLARVLALCGISAGGERVTAPVAPPRDPFRRR